MLLREELTQSVHGSEHARSDHVEFAASGTTLQCSSLGAVVVGGPDERHGQNSFMHGSTIAFPRRPRGGLWLICG